MMWFLLPVSRVRHVVFVIRKYCRMMVSFIVGHKDNQAADEFKNGHLLVVARTIRAHTYTNPTHNRTKAV